MEEWRIVCRPYLEDCNPRSSKPVAGFGSPDLKPQGVEVWRPYLKDCKILEQGLEVWTSNPRGWKSGGPI